MLATRLFQTLAQRIPLLSSAKQTLSVASSSTSSSSPSLSSLSLSARFFSQDASGATAPKRGPGSRKPSGDSEALNDISKELTFGSGPKISPVLPSTIRHDTLKSLRHEVVHINRIGYVKEGGKVIRFAALVVVGNRKGIIGFGQGKSGEQSVAINKAISDAHKNLLIVPREANGSLPCETVAHFGQCKVVIRRIFGKFDVVACKPIASLCRLGGINGVSVKVYGSRNYLNTIRAFFKGLGSMMTPEEVAQARGLPMYNSSKYELRLRQAK